MKAGPRELEKGEYLFREGEESDAAYVVKSGRLEITKSKGSSEIILAEIGPGAMLGEMAFFDNKSRSAGARAISKTVVITLPFKALNAQFKTFPEWLKVMVKTINQHLRDANQRIKNLDTVKSDDEKVFDPHTITRLLAILTLVASKYGEDEEDGSGCNVPTGLLRSYTIQIFQQPTNKMVKLTQILQEMGHATIEDLGEGRQKLVLTKLPLLCKLVNFYNTYLFKDEAKRTNIEEREVKLLSALKFYAEKALSAGAEVNKSGHVTVSLTDMQNESMKDLGELVKVDGIDALAEKKLCGEKISADGGVTVDVDIEMISPLIDYWSIIYTLLNYKKD